jgi:hypothetical protein
MIKTKFLRRLRDEAEPGKPVTDWRVKRAALVDSDKVLLSRTHLWLRRFPGHCQPKQLCRYYPRVANALAECWDDTALGDRLLIDLMTDSRGTRAGFPLRIVEELQLLRRLRTHDIGKRRIRDRLRDAVSSSLAMLRGFRASQF